MGGGGEAADGEERGWDVEGWGEELELKAGGGDGGGEVDGASGLVILGDFRDDLGGGVRESGGGNLIGRLVVGVGCGVCGCGQFEVADAEWHVAFRVTHEDGFHGVVEVGIEVDFDGGDGLWGIPSESDDGFVVREFGGPGVGVGGGAAGAVGEVFGGEGADGWLDDEGEIFSGGAAFWSPELEGVDADAGWW